MFVLKDYDVAHLEDIIALFVNTVHKVNIHDYSAEQCRAWTGDIARIKRDAWHESLSRHKTRLAFLGHVLVGFGDIDSDGYLDRLYVHHAYQGQGIATLLCDELEAGHERVYTHASITARPFFEKRGYSVVLAQTVIRDNIKLNNFVMEKG